MTGKSFSLQQARREAERIARIRASGEVIGGDVVVLGGGNNGGAEEEEMPRKGVPTQLCVPAGRPGRGTGAWRASTYRTSPRVGTPM